MQISKAICYLAVGENTNSGADPACSIGTFYSSTSSKGFQRSIGTPCAGLTQNIHMKRKNPILINSAIVSKVKIPLLQVDFPRCTRIASLTLLR